MKKRHLDFFIARRISSEKGGRANRVMTRVATLSVAVGTAVMIIALGVITGFKKEISTKVSGLGGDVQLVHLDGNVSMETRPILSEQPFLPKIKDLPYVTNIAPYAVKAGILKTDEAMQGILLKGVDAHYDWKFIADNLTDGEILTFNDSIRNKDVMISATLSRLMQLKMDDRFEVLFISDGELPRRDRFKVKGIYDTQLPEFDKILVMTDIRNVQRLNDWEQDRITGFEITLENLSELEEQTDQIDRIVTDNTNRESGSIIAFNIRERYPNIFEWIDVQDINVIIIITIMLLVAGFTMISMVLTVLLEKTSLIGMLKAIGMKNGMIQRIFIIRSSYIILKGLLWGNIAGLVLCAVQYYTGLLKLNETGYFLTTVPIRFDWMNLMLLNAGSFAIIVLLLIIPTILIARMSPDKSIKYE